MTFADWIPSLSTGVMFSAAAWLARKLIVTRLTSSVAHEFNVKIETVRKELRDSEERLKADLKAREVEIQVLRSGAMSAMTSRQIAIDKRRLEAIDQLWESARGLGPARGMVSLMAVVNYEIAASASSTDPRTRRLFDLLGKGFEPKSIDSSSAIKARPYVSEMSWAIFVAMQAIIGHCIMRFTVLKTGISDKDFIDSQGIQNLLTTALPEYREYIREHGTSAYPRMLDTLEEKLLAELRAMFSDQSADRNSVERAAEIIKQSNALLSETERLGATT